MNFAASLDLKSVLGKALGLNQGRAQFELRIGPFVGGELTVVSFQGYEAMNEPFFYDVLFSSSLSEDELHLGIWGLPACLSIHAPQPHAPRIIQGIAVDFEGTDADAAELASGARRYVVRIAPRLWGLSNQTKRRVFQGKTPIEIACAVLKENGIKPHVQIPKGDYPTIPFEYQEEETDLAFITRVLATAGIFYYFRHASGLLDSLVPGGAEAAAEVGAVAGAIGGFGGAAAGVAGFVSDTESALGLVTTLVLTDTAYATERLGDSLDVAAMAKGALSTGLGAAAGGLTSAATSAFGTVGGSVAGAVAGAVGLSTGQSDPLVYDGNGQAVYTATERVYSFGLRSSIRPKEMNLRNWNLREAKAYTASKKVAPASANLNVNLTASISLSGPPNIGLSAALTTDVDALPIAPSEASVFEYQRDLGLQNARPDWAHRMASRALAQARSDGLVGHGETDCRRLAPGYRFTLQRHPIDPLNTEYLVTEIRSQGYSPDHLPSPTTRDFQCTFRCVPSKVDPRPKKPAPKAHPPEPAIVVGRTPGDVYCDGMGRILVRFRWAALDSFSDAGFSEDGEGVCWVHWLERWGGNGYGTQTIPRVGSEVRVEFYAGGEPTAVGQTRSRLNPPAFNLPREATKVGIKSRVVPNGAESEISIDDNPDTNKILVHSSGDFVTEVVRNTKEDLGGTYDLTVAAERREATSGDAMFTFATDATTGVAGNLREEVGKDRTEIVLGSVDEWVGGDLSKSVGGRVDAVTHGAHSAVFGADALGRHFGHHTVVVAAVGTDGQASSCFHVEGAARAYAKKEIEAVSPEGFTLTCGDSHITIRKDSVTIASPTITLVGKTVQVTASDTAAVAAKTATIAGSDSVTVTGANKATLAGQSATVVLDSNATVQGSKVKLGSGGGGSSYEASKSTSKKVSTITLADSDGNPIPNQRVVLRKGGDGGEERVVVLDKDGQIAVEGDDAFDVLFEDCALTQDTKESGAMRPYVVRQGDFMLLLASRYGFDPDSVWNHAKNDPLRKLDRDPNTLQPGDVLYIPEPKRTFHPVNIGRTNAFVSDAPRITITLTLTGFDGKALANASCKYRGLPPSADPTDAPESTDASGTVKVRVPVRQGSFVVDLPEKKAHFNVLVGHMDPVTEQTGAEKRLRNLGYGASPLLALGGSLGYHAPLRLESQITAFQLDQGVAATGSLDQATIKALTTAHGS